MDDQVPGHGDDRRASRPTSWSWLPRIPTFAKTIPKVTIWLDTSRAVSLKQVFDEGEGQSRVCYYTDIKVNQPLPKSAFSFDTGK